MGWLNSSPTRRHWIRRESPAPSTPELQQTWTSEDCDTCTERRLRPCVVPRVSRFYPLHVTSIAAGPPGGGPHDETGKFCSGEIASSFDPVKRSSQGLCWLHGKRDKQTSLLILLYSIMVHQLLSTSLELTSHNYNWVLWGCPDGGPLCPGKFRLGLVSLCYDAR